ncbi:MAG: hypothetical protein CVT88_02815 [Candidatus Altiarchaeales archaeon HGW-Altiarchaeales-1]|nr:MAG: hypothetical protein CVT88_02815 [Candidatus Altiarchaeales archaeon HGW-Altiarchaeales-1]
MEEKIDNECEDDEEKESAKFKTIVAKQVVQALRVSHNNISEFVSKVQEGKNFTQEDVVQAQNDTVAAFYMSMLLSDESKNKKDDKNQK